MKTKYEKVKSLDHLKKMAGTDGPVDVFILLNFGLRSTKEVEWNDGWTIWHSISDTMLEYKTDKELKKSEEFFIEAINKGAVWKENYEYDKF